MSDSRPVEKETRVSLWLFGKPAWEIDGLEGGDVSFDLLDEIEALGKELHERLQGTVGVARKLLDHGWDAYGGLYDITFYKPIPMEVAKKELKDLGMAPEEMDLEEEEIEDE